MGKIDLRYFKGAKNASNTLLFSYRDREYVVEIGEGKHKVLGEYEPNFTDTQVGQLVCLGWKETSEKARQAVENAFYRMKRAWRF